MTTLSLTQSATAVAINSPASFLGLGGTGSYTYSVLPGGAGGTIDPVSGAYRAPPSLTYTSPPLFYDTVQVTDTAAATATAQMFVGTPVMLVCDIIQTYMGLAQGRVFLWDQKIFQPTDSALYISVAVPQCRPFGNSNVFNGTTNASDQFVAMGALLQIDATSRSAEARDRKEEIILALNSDYARRQQNANSFYIGVIPPHHGMISVDNPDGAAIPYRYRISVNIQYAVSKSVPASYFDSFSSAQTTVNA